MKGILIYSLVSAFVSFTYAQGDPVKSVQGLITRLLGPQYVNKFELQPISSDPTTGNDVFELDSDGSVVVVRGNTGVAIASGLGFYLKYYCNSSFSWGINGTGNQINLPSPLPLPQTTRTVSPVKWRYAWNVCTFGYSFVWYSFDQWQYQIDLLALWGINLPLAFNGEEYVLDQFYRSLGLNDTDLYPFFSGPAFLPWQRMGNLQGWGGPLDLDWMTSQRDLQLQIVVAMRLYGMTPVLPGFAGHVPNTLPRIFPNANYTTSAGWGNFNSTYSADTLLEPTDPLFLQLGTQYNKMVLALYGDPTGYEVPVFNADMYNEMDPSSHDPSYLKACNAAVYQAIVNSDPRAIYMMQAWLFHSGFWGPTEVQAYLSGVPIGSMLVLDLNTEAGPVWNRFDSFYGHQWIWNALLVYGGRRGIYGNITRVLTGPVEDITASPTMVGTGVTPEAIDMVPMMFDAMFEMGWRSTSPDPNEWMQQYAVRRYGRYSPSIGRAYATLKEAAFNRDIDTSSIEKVPQVNENSEPGFSRNTNATGILEALRLFYAAAVNGEIDTSTGPFSYDLTDLTRQVLCNLFSDLHTLQGSRFVATQGKGINSTQEITLLSTAMMDMIFLVDKVNGADPNFLLGPWLEDAKSWGFTPSEVANREFNARNQITLWGPNGEIIDYAAKSGWAGLVKDFYAVRWQMMVDVMINATKTGVAPDWGAFYAKVLAFEQWWGVQNNTYPTSASGDPVALAEQVLTTYTIGNSSQYKVYPNTDAGLPPAPKWVHLGDNVAAVGDDCPYEAHGPGDSLAACEAACARDMSCNVINYSSSGSDCVFRVCTDPANPTLTPLENYSVYAIVSPKGGDIMAAWHTDLGVLMWMCSLDPACQGFNTAGSLKSNTTQTVPQPGVNLYVKVTVAN